MGSPTRIVASGVAPTGGSFGSRPFFALVARSDFKLQVNGVLLSFTAGQVITDPVLIEEVQAQNAPCDAVADQDDLVQCPHCRRHFTVEQAVEAED